MNMFCCQDTRVRKKEYPLSVYNEFTMRDPITKQINTEIVPFQQNRLYEQYRKWNRVKVLSRNYKQLFRQLKQNQSVFVDIQFPHTNQAIIQEHDEKKIKWMRVGDIIDDAVYSKEYNTKSLETLKSSNKELQNALILIARAHPMKFKELLSKTLNEYGIYEFRLYKDGIIQNVVIDDFLPVFNKIAMFTGPVRNKEVYPMLLQKAIAKLYGRYELVPTDCQTLMQTIFCGAVRRKDFFSLESKEQIITIINQGLSKNGLVILVSKIDSKVRNYGIYENQMYHIINSYIVTVNGVQVRLYECLTESRLNAWNGKFCLNDEIWKTISPQIKHTIFAKMKKNKSFCVCEQDISRIFEELMIFEDTSTANKDWIESTSETDSPAFVKFFLQQQDRVFIRTICPNKSRQTLILSRIHEGNQVQYIGGAIQTSQRSVQFSKMLEPGNYVICSLHEWFLQNAGEYRVFLSSNTHTTLTRAGSHTIPNYFENMFFNYSFQNDKESTFGDKIYSFKLLVYEIGLSYLHIRMENSTKKILKLLINQKVLKDEQWSILEPYKGIKTLTVTKVANKNNDKIIVLKCQHFRLDKKIIFPSAAFTIQE